MKVLVTGGAGFLGSHLCEELLNKGNIVVCIDNFLTSKEDNIKHLFGNPNFKFINHDIRKPIHLEGIDQIYNLACPASPKHYQENPVGTANTNVLGIINMLELAKVNNSRILQASTSEIYGDPLVHPQIESYWGNVNTIGIRSCYDEGKRMAETLLFDYHRQFNVDIRLVRIFNTYGPRMEVDDGRVVSNFIIQALKNQDISIYGNGNQTRSFCYVDDLIDGLIKMMNNKDFIGPVNLGNPNEMTIEDLAKKVIELTGSKSKINYHPLPKDDPKKRKPDISLAKEKLLWSPSTNIDKGLKQTAKYFERIINE